MPVISDTHWTEATARVIKGVGNGLESAAQVEKENIEQKANQDQDALGSPWASLSESTIKQKGFDSILFETGDMMDSLYVRQVSALAYALGVADPKIHWHENGTESMPPRKVLSPAKIHLINEVVMEKASEAVRKELAYLNFRAMF